MTSPFATKTRHAVAEADGKSIENSASVEDTGSRVRKRKKMDAAIRFFSPWAQRTSAYNFVCEGD